MEAKRKKWTAREDVTDDVLTFREKRKWQVAFRRYILERNISQQYAPYFGLDIEHYRTWIELQFTEGLNWDNFGKAWQFEHIIPVSYFDFSNEDDLSLCWNFINIRVTALDKGLAAKVDLLTVLPFFESLYAKTGFSVCRKMLEKITQIQKAGRISEPKLEDFIISNIQWLEQMPSLTTEEYINLNRGTSLDDIFLEREIIRKFG